MRSRTELTHLAGGSYVADLASLQAGRSATFRVRLAGDGMDQQPTLAFAVAPQVGTLTPSAANASASGEALTMARKDQITRAERAKREAAGEVVTGRPQEPADALCSR